MAKTLKNSSKELRRYGTGAGDGWRSKPQAGSVSGVPDISALPVAAAGGADWNNFPGASWAVNSAWVDSTGVTLRRLTNASSVSTNTSVWLSYGQGGPRISRPWGTNSDYYWVVCYVAGVGTRFFAYQRGVGIDPTSWRTAPIADNAEILYAFGSEPHIVYISTYNSTTPSEIRRYNVNTQAYEANSVFTGANAAFVLTGQTAAAWTQFDWSGTWLAFQSPISGPTTYNLLNVTDGTHYTLAASRAPDAGEMAIFKTGSPPIVGLKTSPPIANQWYFWFPANDKVSALANSRAGHSDAGSVSCWARNPDSSAAPWVRTTPGTAPASDLASWTGTSTDFANAGSNAIFVDENYPTSNWDQTGNATEYMMGSGYGVSTGATVNGWSIDSGSVYKTTLTFGAYQAVTRGVNAVLVTSGTTIVGHLDNAGSRGAMTAGTYYWDGTTLYVWMSDSSDPNGVVRIQAAGKLDHSVGYISMDVTDVRKLCYSYCNHAGTFDYNKSVVRANWSPDGKVVIFQSNFGVQGGRVDLISADVPLS